MKIKKPSFKRSKKTEDKIQDALASVPRITNDTVSDHREEVLRSARKYIYPLQHSKHRVVRTSLVLLVAVVILFFGYVGYALYRAQSTSGFVYAVTKVVPLPVAKAGPSFVSYESYLFELRRNMHYYQTQQQANFSTKDGKAQLKRLKQQTMGQVVQDAYVKQLAEKNAVSVSARDVDNQLTLVRSQNRLGSSNRVFKDVLNEFWGWNENDFKRELKSQLLQQAVASKLDTMTQSRANTTLKQLKGGADFAATATQVSDDQSTKPTGGAYSQTISPNDRDLAPAVTSTLFRLKPGEVSDVVNTGYTLEILKVIDKTASSLHAAHIQFTIKPITEEVKPLQAEKPSKPYIKL